jgi:HlyD family secretion protein
MAKKKIQWGLIGLSAVAGIFALFYFGAKGSSENMGQYATFTVQRGPLVINIIESGTIKAREQLIIKNEVEGQTSIITLIPEGTRVKKGDLLVELDASTLMDQQIDQEIHVQNAEASYINAKETLAVVENQAQSDVDQARLTVQFAELDLKKYVEGEYQNELRKAQNEITLADAELQRAKETLEWSRKLFNENFVSQTELQADELTYQRRLLELEVAGNNLELLKEFTYQRNLAQYQSDVEQAKMALERTERKAKADVIQAQAELRAKEAEYQRQQDKLRKIEDQIRKTKLYAPADGLVIYATSARGGWRGNDEPLQEGRQVREREELIYLPVGNSYMAEVLIHETNVEKLQLGAPAIVKIDALSGKKFLGSVQTIAPLPDAQSMWMNPDLKIYPTEIHLEETDDPLRTGMSCQAEIVIARYSDTLYVPVQAVLRVGGRPTVYVIRDGRLEERPVRVGLDNNRMIHVLEGLEEGEQVVLNPPLKAGIAEERDEEMDEESRELNSRLRNMLENGAERQQPSAAPESAEPSLTPAAPDAEPGERGRRMMENLTPEQRDEMRRRMRPQGAGERPSGSPNP